MPKFWLYYHVTWSTKDRLPLIDGENREIIIKSIITKCAALGTVVLAINGVEDHMHLLLSVPPTVPPSTLIGQIKGVSSHLVRHLGWKDFRWQTDYAIKAIPEDKLPVVILYINNQQKHHGKR